MSFTGLGLPVHPMKHRYRCDECGAHEDLTMEQTMSWQGCREEIKAKGGAYPRSCPTCKFGPCTKKRTESPTVDYAGVWKHGKTGGLYQVICEGENEADLVPVVVYQSLTDKRIWVRSKEQFLDGRFTKVSIL